MKRVMRTVKKLATYMPHIFLLLTDTSQATHTTSVGNDQDESFPSQITCVC
jgi:hypothetical protein